MIVRKTCSSIPSAVAALAAALLVSACGDSNGPFAEHSVALCGAQAIGQVLATDLTGNGADDVAVSCTPRDDDGTARVEIWQSNDDGQLERIQRRNLDATHDWPFGGQMTAADINGDGRPDLMVVDGEDGDTGLSILYGRANGPLGKPHYLVQPHYDWDGWVAAADINGDGHQDVIPVTGRNSTFYKAGNGKPLKTLRFRTNMAPDDRRAVLKKAHLDRDGRIDAVLTSPAAHTLTLYHSSRAAERLELDKSWPDFPLPKTGGRFDGDDKTDLLYYTIDDDQHAEARLLLTAGGIHKSKALPIPLDKFDSFDVDAAQVNDDDRLDLIVRLETNKKDDQLLLLAGQADGTFKKVAAFKLPGRPHTDAIGDFNADGKADYLIYQQTESEGADRGLVYMSES